MDLVSERQPKEEVFNQIINMIEALSKDTELATKLRATPQADQVREIVTALLALGIIDHTKTIGVSKMLNSGNPIVPANLRAAYERLAPIASAVESAPEREVLPPVPVFSEAALERKQKVFLAFMTPEKLEAGLREIFAQLGFQDGDGKPLAPEVINSIIDRPDYWEDDKMTSDILKAAKAYHERRNQA